MKIAVIGSGFIGGELGRLWAEKGHTVTFGSRDTGSEKMQQLLSRVPTAKATSNAQAIADADVVLVALPAQAITAGLTGLDLNGKIVIDAMNKIGGGGTASAEILALSPQAKVVKAFNSIGGENYAQPVRDGIQASMPIAGDDEGAKKTVTALVEELGFEAVDVGPISLAGALEQMAMAWVQLAGVFGAGTLGRDFVWKILR